LGQAQAPAPVPPPPEKVAPTTEKSLGEIKITSTTQPAAGAATTTGPLARIKLYGHADIGYTYNPDQPKDHINFGRLFDDRANSLLLNQILVTLGRPLDSTAQTFDWGFKLQVMYGSDARYIHSLGLLDNVSDDRNQPDIVEAYLNTHFPLLTPGGIDVKAGKFVTLEGAEVIDSTGNFFYSHSYIFNFGIPLTHLGVMTTTHLNKYLDLYAGITRGVNVAFNDNNGRPAFHGGVGLNLWDGKATVLASTHIGPEDVNDNENLRYLNDITATIKLTEKLTSITDMNYSKEDLGAAQCYGVAQYFTYAFNDWLSAGIRGEVFRDDKGFFVAAFPENDGFVDYQLGESARVLSAGPATYGELTFGLNIKPVKNLLIRPEVRYDRALDDKSRPFNDFKDRGMFTSAVAVTYSFSAH
jgi:hypothetical protein